MKRGLKRALVGAGVVVVLAAASAGTYVAMRASSFDASMDKVYVVPLPSISRSSSSVVIARGKHLAESVTGCATRDCHGSDLGGGNVIRMGPVASIAGPNITGGGLGAAYNDGELARLIRHGIKKDNRSVCFMPVQNFSWLSDSDLTALVSYVRTVPSVQRPTEMTVVKTLGKVLDRRDQLAFDIARRIDHEKIELAKIPQPTAEYGHFLARLCTDCHGEHLSGGPIPGAPAKMGVPLNLTPHESGLKEWSFEDFEWTLRAGVRKNGKGLSRSMPYEAFSKFDEIEKQALWAYLRALPPLAFGQR